MKHSAAFLRVLDAILALDDDKDRAGFAAMLGPMTVPHRKLGALRAILRAIAALDDDDLEGLARWFSTHVNTRGQTPRATSLRIDPNARRDPPGERRS